MVIGCYLVRNHIPVHAVNHMLVGRLQHKLEIVLQLDPFELVVSSSPSIVSVVVLVIQISLILGCLLELGL
jgi:hypothetical protein